MQHKASLNRRKHLWYMMDLSVCHHLALWFSTVRYIEVTLWEQQLLDRLWKVVHEQNNSESRRVAMSQLEQQIYWCTCTQLAPPSLSLSLDVTVSHYGFTFLLLQKLKATALRNLEELKVACQRNLRIFKKCIILSFQLRTSIHSMFFCVPSDLFSCSWSSVTASSMVAVSG